jgi:hypothetical protein
MSWLSEAIHHGDAPTISAVAAWAAAGIAGTVAGIQFFIGRKQAQAALTSANAALMSAKNAGRYKIAEFRQAWINKVIDTLCEQNAFILARSDAPSEAITPEEATAVFASRTRLEILLNPEEADTVALLAALEKFYDSRFERHLVRVEFMTIGRRLLKREWVRIKDELSHQPTE